MDNPKIEAGRKARLPWHRYRKHWYCHDCHACITDEESQKGFKCPDCGSDDLS